MKKSNRTLRHKKNNNVLEKKREKENYLKKMKMISMKSQNMKVNKMIRFRGR
jgi:hypothetical protein